MRLSRAALLVLSVVALGACGGASRFQDSPSAPTPPPPRPPAVDEPPVIDSIQVTPPHVEFRTDASIDATVHDQETPVEKLTFEWSASLGTFSGSGPHVTWRADKPLEHSPVKVEIGLKVSEEVDAGDHVRTQSTSGTLSFILNDSYKEIRELVDTFLIDFTNYNAAPDYVVRNFSSNCAGKNDELRDVAANRNVFVIRSGQWNITSIQLHGDGGDVIAPCSFVSTVKATGKTETATGTCLFTTVYEGDRWYLCDSHFKGRTTDTLRLYFHR